MATRPKRPRDPFQLAKLIGDISTGQTQVATRKPVTRQKPKTRKIPGRLAQR